MFRMIVSVCLARMNKILWIDKRNMLVGVGPGMRGILFEHEIEKEGFVVGHEPVS